MEFAEEEKKPTYVMHDADTKFTRQFDEIFKAEGIKTKKHLPASPNLNAYVERWGQSVQVECLDHFVVLGEKHLQHIVSGYVRFYNEARPHEGCDNLPPAMKEPPPEPETICLENVVCRERLGGLLKQYECRNGGQRRPILSRTPHGLNCQTLRLGYWRGFTERASSL